MEKFLAANLVIFYTTSGGELYYGATVDDVVDALNDKAQAWKFELSSFLYLSVIRHSTFSL